MKQTKTGRTPPAPVRSANVFALSREERVGRGLELARRDPLTALRVAVIEHGRHPMAVPLRDLTSRKHDRKYWHLMWWGNRPRRFLPDGRKSRTQSSRRGGQGPAAHSKTAVELATWYHAHADELPENWGLRFLAAVAFVAIDRYQFPRFSMQSWGLFAPRVPTELSPQPGWLTETPEQLDRYLDDVRYYRDYLLKTAGEIESYVARLAALDADSSSIPTANGLTAGVSKIGAIAAENQLGHAAALRVMAGFLAIHGRAAGSAIGAARGIFVRVLDHALGPRVPAGLRRRVITMLLEDLNFGSRKNLFRDSSTLKNVQAILRAAAERRSN